MLDLEYILFYLFEAANGVQTLSQTPKNKPASVTNVPQSNTPKSISNHPQPQPQTIATSTVQDLNNKMVPIQLTLPAPAGSQDTEPRIYNIQVPASALASKKYIFDSYLKLW